MKTLLIITSIDRERFGKTLFKTSVFFDDHCKKTDR